MESTIRAEGGRLRVTATLIRVRDQEHVWSQSYDREPTSLLGLQQELSTSIAEQIRLRLSPDHLRGVRQRQTQNADAYDAYLRGTVLPKPANAGNERARHPTVRACDRARFELCAGLGRPCVDLRGECLERRCPPARRVAARARRRRSRSPRQCESRRGAAWPSGM